MGANLIGQQLEHYRIESVIGEGGMGTVYRAEDINLARPVAIKIMHSRYAMQDEFQRRFQQEAQAAARLEHPSIVRVYHFGREQGYLYIVMELVPGLSLGAYLKQLAARDQIIRLDETILLMAQVADALGYAHHKGIVHRDVKPDNILVKQLDLAERPDEPPLRAVMTDFGLAKLMEGGVETKPGEFMGTLAYISPEQILEQSLDGRSDIYSLGVVLFQLATGQLPFRVRTPSEAILKHIQQPPPVPHVIKPGLPLALEQVILKAMAKEPEERYHTGEEFATSLRQAALALSNEDNDALLDSTQSSVTSMVVELDSNPNLANTSRWQGEKRVKPPVYDRLLVNREGEEEEMYSLYKSDFSIGRSESNDIVLVGSNVSRWHARLAYTAGQWQITDTGSTNGTFLDDIKLVPDLAHPLSASQIVRIGPFLLRLEIPAESAGAAVEAANLVQAPAELVEAPVEAPAAMPMRVAGENITADLRPKQLKKPGICRVMLLNKGDRRTTVTVSCHAPNARIRFDAITKQVTLSPGQKGIVDFYLEADKRPFIGGRQKSPFNVHISTAHQEWARLSGQLSTAPLIPLWLLLLFFILFLAFLAALIYGLQFLPQLL
ncbi:MAG: FHA domain-containing serine/threonine-protein kinase [Candidatus Promineifilaceae bacterium]|nr:FHA domain-containing serine/threonine-protein kinase [Candidatus Promineifilaceae bacterium]